MDNLQSIKAQFIAQINAYQPEKDRDIVVFQCNTETTFSLLAWLKAQQYYPQFYLHGRDGATKWASIGQVRQFSDVSAAAHFIQEQQLALLGGLQFYGDALFVLPRLLLQQRQDGMAITLFIDGKQFEQDKLVALACLSTFEKQTALQMVKQKISLISQKADQAEWCRWVEQGLQKIKQGELSKIVLANERCFKTAAPLAATDLLAESEKYNLGCYHFMLAESEQRAFIGSSPELLYRRHGLQLKTEALAGTAFMGEDEQQNQQQSDWLLHDKKNEYENQLVVDGICQNLQPFVQQITIEKVELKKLRKVQHLRRRISAQLKAGCGDKDILLAMHPTAAVAGLPQLEAKQALRKLENFDRTWYAGTLGVMGPAYADFCVTIRSAFIEQAENDSQLCVFAGAGIVEGSIPLLEWREIERKAMGLVSLLQQNQL
ncbi:isochorismate synthase [Pasteurella multocida]|uniref:isochorismate synthase n=1 Tax=Pasteurella multocida TaxID=747 RepID=UPI00147D3AE3|nr:isochorismate synthase MenF [Pasteurella multocida]NNI30892.1 isochorismate synthase [Pasteurella multocida]NNI61232.1 isochorismate synthase [Pasteurella multocida]NNI76115.1 isochorismate synthase [Pasteurella multocida]